MARLLMKQTKKVHDVYCSAPWRGITVRENGDVKTCCVGATVLGNLQTKSIQEIVEGDALRNIQAQMRTGASHPNCASCIEQEQHSNHASLRQHYQKHYPYDSEDLQLQCLDIRWNNRCNLACQYCGPQLSSTWQKRLGQTRNSARNAYQDSLLEWILERAHHVREIMLVGGEPMLMAQNHQLIERLPEQCQISIITNLSYRLDTIRCWDNLAARPADRVIWNVSGENTGERFEYVRNGANWHTVEQNLQTLVKQWPTTVCVPMVYSIYNAFDLLKNVQSYVQLGVNKFSIMHIADNPVLDVFNWGEHAKTLALEQLLAVKQWHSEHFGEDRHLYPIDGVDNLIKGLQNVEKHATITYNKFCDGIGKYDRNRGSAKHFRDLWPDVVALAKQELL